MDKQVRWHRLDENSAPFCQVYEDGEWTHWKKSKFWESIAIPSGEENIEDRGFFCFTRALNQGYKNVY